MKNKNFKRPDTILKNGKKIRKRTPERSAALWKLFQDKYADDFKDYMGYGVEDIERIGIEEFLDAMDWYYDSDLETTDKESGKAIPSYESDSNKVLVCSVCHNAFATFPLEYGICPNCLEHFDKKKMEEEIQHQALSSPNDLLGFFTLIAFDEEVRETFRKAPKLQEISDNSDGN